MTIENELKDIKVLLQNLVDHLTSDLVKDGYEQSNDENKTITPTPELPPLPDFKELNNNDDEQITIDELNERLIDEFIRLGNDDTKINNVIKKYGAQNLNELSPDKYNLVLNDVKQLTS